MSDQEKAVAALNIVLGTCKASDESISSNFRSAEGQNPALNVLHDDLLSLLSFIYSSTTKLALALKPSSPTYSACQAPLKDLSERISALSHCVNMFDSTEHGATITQEAVSLVHTVNDSVGQLVQTFLDIEQFKAHNKPLDDYMVKVGAVHEIIETARSSVGLSKDNMSAVRKKWAQDVEPLEDGVREVRDMIDDTDQGEDEDEDDGWDELDLGLNKHLDKDELRRAEKIYTVLRLSTLLHKKILSDVLSSSAPLPPNTSLDKLPSSSSTLLRASDDVVASLYSPQIPETIQTELEALRKVVDDIRSLLSFLERPDTLESQLDGMSLRSNSLKSQSSTKKWLDGCFDQLSKALHASVATLVTET